MSGLEGVDHELLQPPLGRTLEQYSPRLAVAVLRAYRRSIDAIREAAREKGYAIGVHGSLARDIDMIAAPWSDAAVAPEELVEAIRLAIERSLGNCWYPHGDKAEARAKPHGRSAWTLILPVGTFVDLSIMPRTAKSASMEAT